MTALLILCLLSLPLNGAFLVLNVEERNHGVAFVNLAAIVLCLVSLTAAVI